MLNRQLSWAFKSIARSKTQTLAAIVVTAVTIFLVAATLLLGIAGTNFGKTAKARFTLPVYLKSTVDKAVADNLATKIRQMQGVKSVEIFSPDDLLKNEAQNLGMRSDEIKDSIGFNPLPYSLIVTPNDPNDIESIATQIKNYKDVDSVEYESEVIKKFSNLFELFKWISVGLGLLSLLVSSIVISSTIALSITARKEEIEIMSFVGATPSMVKGPFVIEGLFYGLLGGGLAALAVYYGWSSLQNVFLTNLPWFNLSIDKMTFIYIIIGTIGFGVFVGLISSLTSTNSNLRRIRA